jgi:hypothetical protein
MPKAFSALCALGAAPLLLAPIAAYGASANPTVTVSVTKSCSSAHPDTQAAVLFAAPVDLPAIAQETSQPNAVRAAPITVPIAAAAPLGHHRQHQQQAVSVERSVQSDDDAIEKQFRLRVLMPALSGDGGG